MKATISPRARRDPCICAELPAEPDLCCLQHDMNDCYSRLKRLVPTIPQHRRVSRVEILQHVIDYILDLQLALERTEHSERTEHTEHSEHSEHSGTWLRSSIRTPLSVLNTEQRTPVNKQDDTILCR
ncbi:DNA-binding protein inhibitor ID-4 [Bagarius yarrelli]|uniref:DNA-binding protein inhibitor ID-4 n=1 Tax=Bagarius yarrelli TaxID=175774 RepID=A0A556TQA6_BAGYA|nr:DNA-binding protein inhibitor ID-4 [Bagarius yarrelli]